MTDSLNTVRRRSDARRSIDAILNAALTVFGDRPDASMEEIATTAGVTRQTVYAHFPSRDALIDALLQTVGAETLAAIESARLDTLPAVDALRLFLDISWELIRRYPFLLAPALTRTPPGSSDPHGAAAAQLEELIRRGQRAGASARTHAPRQLARRRHLGTRPHRRRTSRRRTPHDQQGGHRGLGQRAATLRCGRRRQDGPRVIAASDPGNQALR